MGIKQLNGTYIPAEDRIVLRVSTDAGEEFRFWLTRPVTAQLLGSIRTLAARSAAQKFPPQVAQTSYWYMPTNPFFYDTLGRTFYAGIRFKM